MTCLSSPATALRCLLLSGVALLAPMADPAVAQESDPAAIALPEMDVQATAWRAWQPVQGYVAPVTTTGTKTDTPLIEAPQSVGVVTRDQMDDQGVRSVSQALRYTPGVLSENRPTAGYDSVFVRGFGGNGSGSAYVNFLDGLRQQRGISYAVPNTDSWLLERIEVLRGPASVLYGQTGSGGIVNLVSRRPTETATGEVRLEAGSYGTGQLSFDSSGPLTADGKFLYRLTGTGMTSQTQYDFTEQKRIAIAPALTWRPDEDTTLTLLANYQYDPEGGYYNFVPAYGTVIASPYGKLHSNFNIGDPNFNTYERTQASVGYQFEHRFNNTWTVRQNFRYQHIDSEFDVVSRSALTNNNRTLTRTVTQSVEHVDSVALDNQVQASFATGAVNHTLLTGLDWNHASSKRRLGNSTTSQVSALNLYNPTYYVAIPRLNLALTQQIQDQLGLYAQDQVSFGHWRFNFGIRQDWATSKTITRATRLHTSQLDSAVTGRVGALYLFDSGIAPYASYATSFLPNSGTFSPARGGDTFKPTTGDMVEVGVKYQPPGAESFVQVALFQITQQNVLNTDPNNSAYSIQTGEIRSRGVEVEGRASLTAGLDVTLGYAYTDAEITKSVTAGVAGNAAPQVPKHAASGWANYTFHEGPLNGFGLGGGLRYVGATQGDEANSFRVPAYTLTDLAARYDLSALGQTMKGFEATLNVSNLFDKEYISSCSATTACWFGTRRLVMAGLRYRW